MPGNSPATVTPFSILERGGKTPALAPDEFYQMGFTMLLYPTTLLFRVARTIDRGLRELRDGKPLPPQESCDMDEFLDIVDMKRWQSIEAAYGTEQ